MKDFKSWWSDQKILAGEGHMDVAEQAWDAAIEITARRCIELTERNRFSKVTPELIRELIKSEFGV